MLEGGESGEIFSEGGGRGDCDGGSASPRLQPSTAVFTGHEEQVLALAHQGDMLFSASADGTAKVRYRGRLRHQA